MRVLKGSKVTELTNEALHNLTQHFASVELDVGTGDGRYIFKNALRNPTTFFIGIEPNQKQLEIYSKKTNKYKLSNIMFVINSIENIQDDFVGIANVLTVNLPWGSLLQAIAQPNKELIAKLVALLKPSGHIKIIFGYTQETEPGEFVRLGLNELDLNHVHKAIIPEFQRYGFQVLNVHQVQKNELKNFESTWSKKLSFGKDRPIYYIELTR